MKYKVVIIIALIILTILLYKNSIILSMKLNWNINIPKYEKIVYQKESEVSFNGDGESYYILEYETKKLDKIEQKLSFFEKDEKIQPEIIEILKRLEVPEELYPNFNTEYKYLKKEKEPFSLIYILLLENKLYIIEQLT